MDKREQDILKKIEDKAKDIKVPESLEPLQIEKMLEEKGSLKERRKKERKRFYTGIALAAACVALVAGMYLYQASGLRGNTKSSASAGSDDKSAGVSVESDEKGTGDSKDAGVESADDYSEIYAYIEKQTKERLFDGGDMVDTMELAKSSGRTSGAGAVASEESADSAASMGSAESADSVAGAGAAESTSDSSDYSGTNTRDETVDEADIVKTDGRYLYVLKENSTEIGIVDTKKELKKSGKISAEKDMYIEEFYVLPEEEKLVAAGTRNGEQTQVITYDISNPEKPKKEGSISQSGAYDSSRLSDGYLYLFSNYWVSDGAEEKEPETYIPLVNDSLIREKDILLPPFESACMYEVVTAVSLENPSEISDSRAIFTNGGELYVSSKNIYYYETNYRGNKETTKIRKIGYANGGFSEAKAGSIDGYINDSFSIDEYGGYLRIVTTAGDSNAVYVLDKNMKIYGSIENLAKDERIYSARFLGDTGYFVTFRQVDPLFSVDFSNPKKPKIVGKLKIPGFSEYLHFYGKDKLLGIGMNADEDSGVTDGAKLSMFDISDKTDVKEVQKYNLKNTYSVDVAYDYKAAVIDKEKNLIGFSASAEGGERYYVFSYDEENGFRCEMSEEVNGMSTRGTRGVYIGDTLYVVSGNVIEAYSLETYENVDALIL